MSTKIYTGLALLMSAFAFSQAGIGTVTPQATLDVVGKPADAASLDGIIAPRMEGAQLRAKAYTASQTGALVYVTLADTAPAGQTADVTAPGYYFFNGTKWVSTEGINLYNSDGSLPENRLVNLNGYNLKFEGTDGIFDIETGGSSANLYATSGDRAQFRLGAYDVDGDGEGSIFDVILFSDNYVSMLATGDVTNVSLGTHLTQDASSLDFFTTPGGFTTGASRMKITGEGNVGVKTGFPTEVLDVKGIARLRELPLNGAVNAHHTLGSDDASAAKDQTFTATRTVVSNADGVLGYVSGLPITPSGFERPAGSTATNFYWRLVGAPTANYGTAGKYSVDASWNPANLSETVAGIPYSTVLTLSGLSIGDMGAKGQNSFVAGAMNSASGAASVAFGAGNQASASGAFTAGILNKATGDNAIAMGQSTVASGNSAIALGNSSVASGLNAVAMGQASTASGDGALAIGNTNQANTTSSIAMGQANQANGLSSIAIGNTNIANGASSVAIGHQLITSTPYSTALGLFNKVHTTPSTVERLFVIGNGTGAATADRSDAFTVLKNGKVGIDIDNFETTGSTAKLQVNGQIKLAPETVAPACNATNEGTIQYFKTAPTTGEFRGCKQTSGTFTWVNL